MAKKWKVVILPGDGTGPEIINATMQVIDALSRKFKLDIETITGKAGFNCIAKYKTNLPESTMKLLKKSDCVIKGPMTTPEGKNSERSVAVKIRQEFNLYANVRPAKSMPFVKGLKDGIDLVIVRENTEGMYFGIDFKLSEDTAIGFRVITRGASERIGKFAFELARKRKKHVTVVHKGNILKATDELFRESIQKIGKDYKDVKLDEAHTDAMTQWLIKNPEYYDIIVTENLFGDILSDEAAMVVGGMGIAPSANIGKGFAMFEPIHGSAPKYAGQDKMNPIATILSVKMMLEWMGNHKAAETVERAVEQSLKDGIKTYDLGGTSKCSEVGRHIASLIK